MNYPYKCDKCLTIVEIRKPMSDNEKEEYCELCNSKLKRIYEACAVATADGFKV